MMKNYNNYIKRGFSWNEFEVVARNPTQAVQFKNQSPINQERDFRVQVKYKTSIYDLDTEQVLDYTYMEDDLEHMDDFRVKRNNERFEFSVENPSDKAYQENSTH